MAIYTRLSDGAVLDFSGLGDSFDQIIGIYDWGRETSFSYGEVAEAREISSYLKQKIFTINIILSGTTGTKQLDVLDFFKQDETSYSVTGEEFSLEDVEFTVIEISPRFFEGGADVISMTCQARFGDFVKEEETEISSISVAANEGYPGFSGDFTNTSSQPITVRVRIEKETPGTLFHPQISTRLIKDSQGVTFTSGKFSTLGELEPGDGKRIVFDSFDEAIEGPVVVSPMTANFWKIQPGATATVTLEPFNPISGESTTVTIYAYELKKD